MPTAGTRPRLCREDDFQADLRLWRERGDPDAAERIAEQFISLANYIAGRRTRTRPMDREDVAAEGVLRCWRYLPNYDASRTTGMNYFAQVVTSRALNSDDAARRRCLLLDKITAKGFQTTARPTQRETADEARLQAALALLSPEAAQVWRRTLDSPGTFRRARLLRGPLKPDAFAAVQEELLAVLGPLLDENLPACR